MECLPNRGSFNFISHGHGEHPDPRRQHHYRLTLARSHPPRPPTIIPECGTQIFLQYIQILVAIGEKNSNHNRGNEFDCGRSWCYEQAHVGGRVDGGPPLRSCGTQRRGNNEDIMRNVNTTSSNTTSTTDRASTPTTTTISTAPTSTITTTHITWRASRPETPTPLTTLPLPDPNLPEPQR